MTDAKAFYTPLTNSIASFLAKQSYRRICQASAGMWDHGFLPKFMCLWDLGLSPSNEVSLVVYIHTRSYSDFNQSLLQGLFVLARPSGKPFMKADFVVEKATPDARASQMAFTKATSSRVSDIPGLVHNNAFVMADYRVHAIRPSGSAPLLCFKIIKNSSTSYNGQGPGGMCAAKYME